MPISTVLPRNSSKSTANSRAHSRHRTISRGSSPTVPSWTQQPHLQEELITPLSHNSLSGSPMMRRSRPHGRAPTAQNCRQLAGRRALGPGDLRKRSPPAGPQDPQKRRSCTLPCLSCSRAARARKHAGNKQRAASRAAAAGRLPGSQGMAPLQGTR
jgi:hypothetical protein